MSLGTNALRGVIDSGSITLFRSLNPAWFIEGEEEAYNFVRAHFRRYARLPDLKTLKENGYTLPAAPQPAQYYIDRLSQRAIYNLVSETHGELINAMRDKDIDKVKNCLRQMIRSTRAVDNRQAYSTLTEQALAVMDAYADAKRRPGLQGITTGYSILDDITNGLQPGDVVALVGRPNIGKSYLLLEMMRKAWEAGHPACVVSMEMRSVNLARRFIGMHTRINPDLIRKGQLSTQYGEPVLMQAIREIENMAPLTFAEGNFRKTVGDVDNMVQEFGPDVVYIDAGYLLQPEGNVRGFSRTDYQAAVWEGIKTMAEDRRVPVVVSAQFNREKAKAGRKGMGTENIAGTDVAGQIATLGIGIQKGRTPYEDITRELSVFKNRDGSLLSFNTNFSFAPMDFSYREGSESTGDLLAGEQEQQQLNSNIALMANSGWQR